jgi:hypothetical protein
MIKNWRDLTEYEYMDDHTPELWAWEFLRRNPEYNRDWESALSAYIKGFSENNYQIKNEIKSVLFHGVKEKWGLFFDEIFNPAFNYPCKDPNFPLFYTYGYFYDKNSLEQIPNLKDSQVLAVFDLSKPLQQQLEYFGELLEEEQDFFLWKHNVTIPNVRNKKIYWKDHLRRFDAVKSGATYKDIISAIFKDEDYDTAVKKVKNSYKRVLEISKGSYLQFLQASRMTKPR